MPDDPAPAPSPAPPPEPRENAEQDVRIAQDLGDIERALTNTLAEPEALALLDPIGFGEPALTGLLALHETASKAYGARATAMGVYTAAVVAKDTQEAAARKAYSKLRRTARARYRRNPAAYAALQLEGDVPQAFSEFLTHAGTTYANLAAEPHATDLAARGYTPERRAELLAGLQALLDADTALTNARGVAVETTGKRDTTVAALRLAYAEFRDTARPALEDHPELLRRIGL